MAKNKGTYRSQREAKEDTVGTAADQVVLAETTSFFTKHRNKVLIACGVIAIGMVVMTIVRWRNHRRAEAATGLFEKAVSTLDAQVVATPPTPAASPLGEEPDVTYPTQEAKLQAGLTAFDQLSADYASTAVSKHAGLARAGVLYDLGRYSDAEKIYQGVAADNDLPAIMRILAREGAARCLEAKALAAKDEATQKAGLSEALTAYAAVQQDPKGLERDAALFHQGRIKALLQDKEGAKAAFKEIVEKMPSSPFVSDATDRLAELE